MTKDDFGNVAFCGYKNPKSDSYRNKTEWLEEEMSRCYERSHHP